MAITPYRRSVGLPDAPSPSGRVSTQLLDAGGAIADIGDTLMKTAEPHIKAKREREAVEDFKSEGLGKDENGNFVVPETPDGGVYYTQAYDAAKFQQYVIESFNQHELALTDMYSDMENNTLKPAELREKALGYIEGAVEAAPDIVKGQLFEDLSREVRERDRAYSAQWLRQDMALTTESLTKSMEMNYEKAMDAFSLGTEEAIQRGEEYLAKIRSAQSRLVEIRQAPENALEQIEDRLVSARGGGHILSIVRGADDASSLQLEQLSGLLLGNMDEEVFGLTLEEVTRLMPSQEARFALARQIAPVEEMRRREEAALAKQLEDQENYNDNIGVGKVWGQTEQEYADAVLAYAKDNGIDPTSVAGMVRIQQVFTKLPGKLYEFMFEDAMTKGVKTLEQLRPMYDAMSRMVDVDGGPVGVASTVMKADDEAFMYHYNNAREGGLEPQTAQEHARSAMEAGLGMELEDQLKLMREKMGGAKEEEVLDQMDDELGTEWGALGTSAQAFVANNAAQRMAYGMSVEDSFKGAAAAFRKEYVKTSYSFAAGRSGRGAIYTRRGTELPSIRDTARNDGSYTFDWVHAYMPVIVKQLGEQTPGVPDVSQLRFQENVWVRSAGPSTGKYSRLFHLVYYDPKIGGVASPLKDKDGDNIVVDLGKAATSQNEAAKHYLRKVAEARHKAGAGKGDALIDGVTDFFGDLITVHKLQPGETVTDAKNRKRPMAPPKWRHLEVPKVKAGTYETTSLGPSSDMKRYMAKNRVAETSGNDQAKAATSDAYGRYQFVPKTWLANYKELYPGTKLSKREILKLRSRGDVQDKVMAHFTAKNDKMLKDAEIPVTDRTRYAMHFLGSGDALKVLKANAKTALASVVDKASMDANSFLKGKTVGWFVRVFLPRKMG